MVVFRLNLTSTGLLGERRDRPGRTTPRPSSSARSSCPASWGWEQVARLLDRFGRGRFRGRRGLVDLDLLRAGRARRRARELVHLLGARLGGELRRAIIHHSGRRGRRSSFRLGRLVLQLEADVRAGLGRRPVQGRGLDGGLDGEGALLRRRGRRRRPAQPWPSARASRRRASAPAPWPSARL